MRSVFHLIFALWMVLLACWGCAGSRDALDTLPRTLNTVEPAEGYIKRIAVVLMPTSPSDLSRRTGDLFYRALLDALQEQAPRIRWITRSDRQHADIVNAIAQGRPGPADISELAETVRLAGLSGWARARVESLEPVSRKTGILMFRKERYFIFAELSFSVYDPFTGAKIIDKVVEISTPVSQADYDALRAGKAVAIADLDETIADLGADIGEHAAEVLDEQFWQTSVIGVQGERVFLSAGSSVGLRGGARLTVFEGRRIIEGQGGERFVVPGPEVGMIRIVRVVEGVAEARFEPASGSSRIEAGDIAAAVQ
jgi:hypothetical protein